MLALLSFDIYISLGVPKRGGDIPSVAEIVMAYLQTILGDESQTIGNSPLRCYSPTLQPNQATNLPLTYNSKFVLLIVLLFPVFR